MTQKHRGGRGRKVSAKIKHIVIAVSLPPGEKALLDSWTTENISRSEVVAYLVRDQALRLSQTIPSAESQDALAQAQQAPLLAPQMPKKAPAKVSMGESTQEEFQELFPVPEASSSAGPRAAILHSLRNGAQLTCSENIWTLTEPTGKVRQIGPNVIRNMRRENLLSG
jgi:hypothetical protein